MAKTPRVVQRSYFAWLYAWGLIGSLAFAVYSLKLIWGTWAYIDDKIFFWGQVCISFAPLLWWMANFLTARSVDRRRQFMAHAALSGSDQAKSLAEFPKPDGPPLQLPIQIKMVVNWRYLWFVIKLLSLIMAPFYILLFIIFYFTIHPLSLEIVLLLLGLFIFFAPLMAVVFLCLGIALQHTMTVTETGISKSSFGIRRSIAWDDAHLFAISSITNGWDRRTLELASKDAIVRWSYLYADRPNLLRANIPTQEYNRILDALTVYVILKTKLSLHDLSDTAIGSHLDKR